MKKAVRGSLCGILALLLSLSLCGCWGSDPLEDPNELDSLIGSDSQPDRLASKESLPAAFSLPYFENESLDPYLCGDGVQQTLMPLLYDGLFELDEAFMPQKLLCAEYSHSEDYTQWTFTLHDAAFSDGTPLRAADVVYSLRRAKGSERYGGRFSTLSNIRANRDGVVMTLTVPNSRFPALLDVPILSEKSGLGTGRYVYVKEENGARLTARSGRWRNETLPVSSIPLAPMSDLDALPHLFSSRSVQMLETDYTSAAPTVYKGNIMVTDCVSTTMHYIGFNCRGGVFSDSAVRRAAALGLYRENICRAYFSGHATPAQYPAAPGSQWYPDALEYVYSAEAYEEAMTAVGRNSGQAVALRMLVCDGNSFRTDAANAIAQMLSEYDFNVTVHALPYDQYIAALRGGQFDLYYAQVRMTPDFDCRALLASGGALNYGGFSDETVDGALAAAFSGGAADGAWASAFNEAAPIAVLCFSNQSVVLHTGTLDAVTPTYADPFYRMSEWKIHLKGEKNDG